VDANRPFRRILAATDLSELSVGALQTALGLAARTGGRAADVTVLHVRHPTQRLSQVEGVFEGHLDRALGALATQVGSMVRSGDAAEEIVAAARERDADVVVVGTHGRTGVRRLVVGSVAEQVAREAPCPVLIVNRRPMGPGPRPGELDRLFPLRTILAPTDGSECSRRGEDLAAILAARCEGSLHLVHAVGEGWAESVEANLLEAKEVVEEAAHALRARRHWGPRVPVITHARTGGAADQIVQCADELRADLIVIGTSGRSGVRERAIGGQTDRVMRRAPCPVLAVRAGASLVPRGRAESGMQRV